MKKYSEDVYHIPLYRGYFSVILTDDRARLLERVPSFDDENCELYAHAMLNDLKGTQCYSVAFNLWHESEEVSHGVICHEATHAANMLCFERGVTASFENDEAHAYICAYFCDCVYRSLSVRELSGLVVVSSELSKVYRDAEV